MVLHFLFLKNIKLFFFHDFNINYSSFYDIKKKFQQYTTH